jgi:mRNA-degrading endonuclease RelE of RelBE toxin-antitoxin system
MDDLRSLAAFDRAKVVDAIELLLLHEPTKVSKSRIKLMSQPFWSEYRLRVDDFRIYYDVEDAAKIVSVLRILHKGAGTTPTENPT